jgi:hypothetical protein
MKNSESPATAQGFGPDDKTDWHRADARGLSFRGSGDDVIHFVAYRLAEICVPSIHGTQRPGRA